MRHGRLMMYGAQVPEGMYFTLQREPNPCIQDSLPLSGCLHYRSSCHDSGPATWAGENHGAKDKLPFRHSCQAGIRRQGSNPEPSATGNVYPVGRNSTHVYTYHLFTLPDHADCKSESCTKISNCLRHAQKISAPHSVQTSATRAIARFV